MKRLCWHKYIRKQVQILPSLFSSCMVFSPHGFGWFFQGKMRFGREMCQIRNRRGYDEQKPSTSQCFILGGAQILLQREQTGCQQPLNERSSSHLPFHHNSNSNELAPDGLVQVMKLPHLIPAEYSIYLPELNLSFTNMLIPERFS